ncbi:hypothetical protein ACAG25_07820 [Mycobacterium sp. pV006]|uniref:hypothetical protein n=1 Tax=Mycobacterium sp. pV006 TaxID=3238983 RepID=UPI00351ADECA
MIETPYSATDAALRQRITELSVHIPCGGIRGPVRRATSVTPMLWQSCGCEDFPVRWDREWADVSRDHDLCIICFRATAGGPSRWSWLACEDCRAVHTAAARRWGFAPFKLGRHSIMNGVSVRLNASPDVQAQQLDRLKEFARGDEHLREWPQLEYRRLAASFDPLADVPLRVWQEVHPPGRDASLDAFARLIGRQ